MAQKQFDLSGRAGVVALVVVVMLVVARAATLGTNDDPALHDAIRARLLTDLGRNLGEALANTDTAHEGVIAGLLERADADRIELHAVAVSKPLLSFGSAAEAIVHCAYTLPGEAREEAYWRFRDQAIGGWRYLGRSSLLSYYLNFL